MGISLSVTALIVSGVQAQSWDPASHSCCRHSAALVTDVLGIHALFGAFLAGAAVSSNASLRRLLVEKVAPIAIAPLHHCFVAITGLRIGADALQAADLSLCLPVTAVATSGKLLGTWGAARKSAHGEPGSLEARRADEHARADGASD